MSMSENFRNVQLLMIDDDVRLSEMVARYLADDGYLVHVAHLGQEGLNEALSLRYGLVILDLMLPDMDGLDLCRRLRASAAASVPILMLTARGETMDRVIGLELGADDYLSKPFEPRELRARVRAMLRRYSSAGSDTLHFGRLEIDRSARAIRLDGETRALTGYQFDILCALAESAGRVLSRDQLMERLRGEMLEMFDRSIDVHISKIRAAIEDDPKSPRRILTLRGVGYLFVRDPDERGR